MDDSDKKKPRPRARDIIKANGNLATKLASLEELLLEKAAKGTADGARDALPDIIAFAYDRFAEEDHKMRLLGATGDLREALEAHIEDHADMMERLTHSLMLPESGAQARSAASILRRWRCEHLHNHDNWLFERAPK